MLHSCQKLYDKILQDTVTFLQFTTFWLPFLWFSTNVQQNVLQNLPHFASISLILYTCTTEFAIFFLDTMQIQHSTSSPVLHPQYYCKVQWLKLEFPKWLFLPQFCPQHGHNIRQFFNNIQGMEAVIPYHFATKPPSVSCFQEAQLLHISCSFLQYWKNLSPKTKHKTLELKLMSKKAYCKTPFGFLTSPPLTKPTQCFNLSKDINKAFKLWLISFRIYHNLLPFLWSLAVLQQNLPVFLLTQSRFDIPHLLHLFRVLNIIVHHNDWNWNSQVTFFLHNSARNMIIRRFFNNLQGMAAVISYHFATKELYQFLFFFLSGSSAFPFFQNWESLWLPHKHKTAELLTIRNALPWIVPTYISIFIFPFELCSRH